VIVGGGHNGLVAAAYLARAGQRVRVLERLGRIGGAAVSVAAFDGVEVRLSRYSYLVSLLPPRIVADLGVAVRLARRRFSSYTPHPATGGRSGLLIGSHGGPGPEGFAGIGAAGDEQSFATFYRRCRLVTERLWPTLLEPLRTRAEARRHVLAGNDRDASAAWRAMMDEPIGHAIAEAVRDDLVRGVMATDALIGTFARLNDPSLVQNTCFLYHVLGGGTGNWEVPVGGMGSVSAALAAAAVGYGAEIITDADVYAVDPDGLVRYRTFDHEHAIRGRFVLAGVTPAVLAGLLGQKAPPSTQGAQVKVNMVLRRLPRLRDETVTAERAFAGTFHVNETWDQLDEAFSQAVSGHAPRPLPCEAYCHSLTDSSILSAELRDSGVHTMTVFGLHTPHSLFDGASPDTMREQLTQSVLASLNSVLAEPVQNLLMSDAHGRPCIETTTTFDLQRTLAMTGGNIFHGALSWPFADDDDPLDNPARQWGVATAHRRILLCGSGARRGGAVSGIGGHNAAMAVLASIAARAGGTSRLRGNAKAP
jgi:phytoene dehydrogenase-like protein